MKILSTTQFFQVQQAIKMNHWATDDYSLHVLLDDFYKDYSKLVDDVVENWLSQDGNSLQVLPVNPYDQGFHDIMRLVELANVSFDKIRQDIDAMPKGMRTILDQVDSTMQRYLYLFKKFVY